MNYSLDDEGHLKPTKTGERRIVDMSVELATVLRAWVV